MNKKISLSIALACVFFADTAMADKIGFINDPELAQKSTALQGLQMQRDKILAVLKVDVEREAEKILSQRQELQGKASSLSQEEVGKQLDEINGAEIDLKRRAQEASAKLQKNFLEAVVSVKEKGISPVVKELAEEKGFNAILNSANAFYTDENLDITEDAIERLNKKMPKVELEKVSLAKAKEKEASKSSKKTKSGKKSK
ncbi:MAG: OmpH family outer membrane protein [Alphaproteobacteria bacterium]|nr:OmpH family outer membrane protein [Alphaproteobacteria bacterium]